jgi:hypothetical protein
MVENVNCDRLISREEQAPHKPQLALLNADVIKAMESRRTLKERIVEEQAKNPPPSDINSHQQTLPWLGR